MKWSKINIAVSIQLFLLFLSSACFGYQKAIDASEIRKNTYYFSIDNGLSGEGAKVLKQELAASQFVLFGELHNSRQSALFFNELLKEASIHQFRKLVLEVGPVTSEVLKDLSSEPEKTVESLKELNQKYNSKNNRYPIPFFKGEEDAKFLSTASELNYDLWGIDQEFALAPPMLFDQLSQFYMGDKKEEMPDKLKAIQKSWEKIKDKRKSCESLESPEIKDFFNLFSSDNDRAQMVIEALNKSWEIYCHYENGEHANNNRTRIDYMIENLSNHIKLSGQGESHPKILIKMGSYHTTRIKSPIGYEDVGHWVNKLANDSGKKSIHIRYMRRYWQGKDKITSKDYDSVQLFMTVGRKKDWALIDLRPIRDQIKAGFLTARQSEINEIFNHDLMLIAPMDQWVKNNF